MTKLPFKNYPKLEKNITVKLTKRNYDRLSSFCKNHHLKMSFVIREMISYWLEKQDEL